jgi:lambda family phage minor tail protein L|tara:strand:+ start:1489 stop:3570 length:2082 start_codon:yes stop_codon:yes gene_type:complete
MAEEGKNKVADSLLDLQPTAILELFRVFPDKVNKPTLFLGFHAGTVFDKSLIWQGVQYLPLSMECEGFDIFGDGKLARPKLRILNKDYIITNFLQNYDDLVNAKIVRKRVSVKYIDDANFDGENPFGVADPKAELTNETWLVGRKTQESKVFVELELASPLDLESFDVSYREVVSKFCYWKYRGEGCRYAGLPVEKADESPFVDSNGAVVVPSYQAPADSPVGFFDDPSAEWSSTRSYVKGDIIYLKNNSVLIRPFNGTTNDEAVPMKTVYVCVGDNTNENPEANPSFWQRDACSKKLGACQRRFNSAESISYQKGEGIAGSFNYLQFSGLKSSDSDTPTNSGLFHTDDVSITGHLTGDWCIVGWTHINNLSPLGAGVFSTSSRDAGSWPNARFFNINSDIQVTKQNSQGVSRNTVSANFAGPTLNTGGGSTNTFNSVNLNELQSLGGAGESDGSEWYQYVIVNDTSSDSVINSSASLIKIYVNGEKETVRKINNGPFPRQLETRLGNFASTLKRESITFDPLGKKAIPQTFMLGAVEQRFKTHGYENSTDSHISTMNGGIGPWALWSRTLSETEISFLYKEITTPYNSSTSNGALHHVPREYSECTGLFTGITGNSLTAWWDGTTGAVSTKTGMIDLHTGNHYLTGSGSFSSQTESFVDAAFQNFSNPTPLYARFGGFPGTDGFNYGRTNSY